MRTTPLAILALVLVAASAAAVNARADADVPFKGTDVFASAVVGGSANVIQTVDVGHGVATHLGQFTMVASETIDFGALAVRDGKFTLTAANGDTISGTYSGTVTPGLTGYLVSGPLTGGTGRFAHAVGRIVFSGTFDAATFTGSDILTGSIGGLGG